MLMSPQSLNSPHRRHFLQTSFASMLGVSASGWFPHIAKAAFEQNRLEGSKPTKHCILLWMSGGPSQMDTFDLKPSHENGGEFKEIQTAVPGMRFSEHLPRLSRFGNDLAIIRSLSTKEGDHERGTQLMKTGFPPMGMVDYPSMGAALSSQLARDDVALPPYVSISPIDFLGRNASGPGYLGPKFSPLMVSGIPGNGGDNPTFAQLKVDAIKPPETVSANQFDRRLALWSMLQKDFASSHPSSSVQAHQVVYENTLRLIHSKEADAFDLSKESDDVRKKYGYSLFGQGCLLARRLVERGVNFVEVSLSNSSGGSFGWDTHSDNFNAIKSLSKDLDDGWASLMEDLKDRGLLESTTILWMGEFGRTPKINAQSGRDHFPRAWSCVFAGGKIKTGQVYGKTSEDGMEVTDQKTGVLDVLATLCESVGVSPGTRLMSSLGRPISIVESSPISDLLHE